MPVPDMVRGGVPGLHKYIIYNLINCNYVKKQVRGYQDGEEP